MTDGCRGIVVVGGGITGLAAAHRLRELDVPFTVLEADARVGGHIRTETIDGHVLEAGPDSLMLTKPAGFALCEKLGLGDDVERIEAGRGRIQILHRGRLRDVPEGFLMMAPTRLGPVARSSLFSLAGKLRMAVEPFVPARSGERDESLGSFVTRRFGREVLEHVAEPILASLFTADADRLSLGATLPRFVEMERRHGSVIRAFAAARRDRQRIEGRHGSSYSNVAAVKGGLGRIIDAIVARLPAGSIRTGVQIERVVAPLEAPRWEIEVSGAETIRADAVIFACPSWATASLLAGVDAGLAAELDRLEYASCATVNLAYRKEDVGRPPSSFGFFVPRLERPPLLAVSFVSVKFPDRAPADRVLLRAFLGGALHPGAVDQDEEALARAAHDALRPLLDLRADPVLSRTTRFPRAMPQYRRRGGRGGGSARLHRVRSARGRGRGGPAPSRERHVRGRDSVTSARSRATLRPFRPTAYVTRGG